VISGWSQFRRHHFLGDSYTCYFAKYLSNLKIICIMVSVISFLLIFNMRLKACVHPLLWAYQQLFCDLLLSSYHIPMSCLKTLVFRRKFSNLIAINSMTGGISFLLLLFIQIWFLLFITPNSWTIKSSSVSSGTGSSIEVIGLL
jgi:hypothetical protein